MGEEDEGADGGVGFGRKEEEAGGGRDNFPSCLKLPINPNQI